MKKVKITELKSEVNSQYDLFITCASYESRCLSVCQTLSPNIATNTVVFDNLEFANQTKSNIEAIKERISNVEVVHIKCEDSLFTTDAILDVFKKDIHLNKILIDITTFTHESLLILIWILKEIKLLAKVTFLYVNASEYSVGDRVGEKWLSKGVKEIRSVLGFPGEILPSRKNHLIVLTGYEYERAKTIIDILQPYSLALGFGEASNVNADKNKNAESHFHNLLDTFAVGNISNRQSFNIVCNDPDKTSEVMINHFREHQNDNIILAPMNNKMSTVGCALAAFVMPQVQICYAMPLQYNVQNYSAPGDECYIFKIDESMCVPQNQISH